MRMSEKTMKKNSFIGGAFVSTMAIIMVKIIGVIYVIPFNALIGEKTVKKHVKCSVQCLTELETFTRLVNLIF